MLDQHLSMFPAMGTDIISLILESNHYNLEQTTSVLMEMSGQGFESKTPGKMHLILSFVKIKQIRKMKFIILWKRNCKKTIRHFS